ncbi:MAG: SDR family NAD(P)-dependent oxidoreductase [Acidimicrobiia bacterium]|nr:SDR family NAD(P)-dependent oxidoreductase [Acidimicrobiia bacterium]
MSKAPFKNALITGASSGIGEAIAHKLGKAGVGMVLVARRKDRLDAIASQYANTEVLPADLVTAAGVDAVRGASSRPRDGRRSRRGTRPFTRHDARTNRPRGQQRGLRYVGGVCRR